MCTPIAETTPVNSTRDELWRRPPSPQLSSNSRLGHFRVAVGAVTFPPHFAKRQPNVCLGTGYVGALHSSGRIELTETHATSNCARCRPDFPAHRRRNFSVSHHGPFTKSSNVEENCSRPFAATAEKSKGLPGFGFGLDFDGSRGLVQFNSYLRFVG